MEAEDPPPQVNDEHLQGAREFLQRHALVRGAPVLGGFDVKEKKFFIPCYAGGESPLLKVVDLFKDKFVDVSRVSLPEDIFVKENGIVIVSRACRELSVLARTNLLKEKVMLVVVRKLWSTIVTGKNNVRFGNILNSAESLKPILDYLQQQLITESKVHWLNLQFAGLRQFPEESLFDFLFRFQYMMDMFLNASEEHAMVRGILDRLDPKFLREHDYVLRQECGKEFLLLNIPTAGLSDAQKKSITFEGLLNLFDDPMRRNAFVNDMSKPPSMKKRVPKVSADKEKKQFKSSDSSSGKKVVCHACGEAGHIVPECKDEVKVKAYREKRVPSKSKVAKKPYNSGDKVPAEEKKPSFTGKKVDIQMEVEETTVLLSNEMRRPMAQTFVDAQGFVSEAPVAKGVYSELCDADFNVRVVSAPVFNIPGATAKKTFKFIGLVNGHYVALLGDTGSDGPILTMSQAQKLKLQLSPCLPMVVGGLGGGRVKVLAEARDVSVSIGNFSSLMLFYVVENCETYSEPILPFAYLLRIGCNLESPETIVIAGTPFHLGEDSTYFPARMSLNSAFSVLEDAAEADAGADSLFSNLDSTTCDFSVKATATGYTAHASDSFGFTLPDLPFGRPFSLEMPRDQQISWVIEGFAGLKLDFPEYSLLELRDSAPLVLQSCADLMMSLRTNFGLATVRPLPVLLDRFGHKCQFDIKFKDGSDPLDFSFVAAPRRHSPAKLTVLSSAIDAYVELGVAQRLDPQVAPAVVLENVFVPVPGAKLRHCVDTTPINTLTEPEAILRTVSMDDHFTDIPNPESVRFKVVLDVAKAWNLMENTPEASHLLTFRGVNGYVRFQRCCFGPMNAPAAWQRFTSDLVDDLTNVRKQVDDIFVFGAEFGLCIKTLLTLIQRCNSRNIPMKYEKIQFFLPSVKFAGRIIFANGTMSPLKDHLDRILNFKNPGQDPSLIRSLLGLGQWLSMYVPEMSKFLEPFAVLIRAKNLAEYDDVKQREALMALQEACRNYVGVRILDSSKPVALFCDACDTAISSALLQPLNVNEFLDGNFSSGFNVVHIDSHLLNATQRRWAVIEKEMWAIMSALSSLKDLIYYFDVHLFSDHRPLRYLFRNALSGGGPARVHRWFIALSGWRISLQYYPGKANVLADAISRADFTFDEVNGYVIFVPPALRVKVADVAHPVNVVADLAVDLPVSIAEATENDCFANVVFWRLQNFPLVDHKFNRNDIEEAISLFETYSPYLSVVGKTSVFFQAEDMRFRCRYVPAQLRTLYFNSYHSSLFAGHPGAKKTFEAVSRFFWWPGMKDDIEERCKKCHRCQVGKPNGTSLDFSRGFESTPVTYPFQTLVCDSAGPFETTERGNRYVIFAVDYTTRFVFATASASNSAKEVAFFLFEKIMLVFGVPQIIKSDRGSEFNNQLMTCLCDRLSINQEVTAPFSAQGVAVNERSHLDFGNFVRTMGAEDWDLLVPYFCFVRNNRINESIGQTPFFAMFGRHAVNVMDAAAVAHLTRTFGAEGYEHLSMTDWVRRLESDAVFRESRLEVARAYELKRFNSKQGKGNHRESVQVGDLVAIRATPLKASVPGAKLKIKWLAPFKVDKVSGPNLTMSYLPDSSIVIERHAQDVKFYFSDGDSSFVDNLKSQSYVIEEILDARGDLENREYLVKWENYPEEFNLWVPRENMDDEKICDEADLKFPSGAPVKRVKDWVVNLQPSDVSSFVGIRETRSGKDLEFYLKGDRVSRRAPISQLPAKILALPEVRSLLSSF